MTRLWLLALIIPVLGFSQKKKNKPLIEEVLVSIEPNVRVMMGLGNTFMHKSLSPFVGFGIAGNFEMYKGFGLD